jgi:hypothetical protein
MNILLKCVSKWKAIEVALMSLLRERWSAGWRIILVHPDWRIAANISVQECLPDAQNLTPVKPICYYEVPYEVAIKPASHAIGMPTRSASIFLEENICLT